MPTVCVSTLLSSNGTTPLHTVLWRPDTPPAAVLQITHGMQEYIERYDPFARFMAQHGFVVVGHDHLGHGHSAQAPEDLGYFGDGDASEYLVEDMHRLRIRTSVEYPGLPYFMLGHSMGSFFLRRYLTVHGQGVAGALILGTGWYPDAVLRPFAALCRGLVVRYGWRHRSELALKLFYSGEFRRFDTDGTDSTNSWLTRDADIVRRYFADPLCNYRFTLSGYYALLRTMLYLNRAKNTARIPKTLPMILLSGQDDPVGGLGKGVRRVWRGYRKAGLRRAEIRLYRAVRHEILNETNKERVWQDILNWCRALVLKK